jgi:transcriptional regulator with XRE-family HTH domain
MATILEELDSQLPFGSLPVGTQIKLIRERMELVQWELARRAVIPQTRLSEYEKNKREIPPDHYERIVKALKEEAAQKYGDKSSLCHQ